MAVLRGYFFMRFHARLCTFWQRSAKWWGEVRSEQIQDGWAVCFPGAVIHKVDNGMRHFGIGEPELDSVGGSKADLGAMELVSDLKDHDRFATGRLPH
jgi:hypothetical protein